MQFVTLCVTWRFFFVRCIEVRLRSPFRPSASHFEGAKVTKAPGSVSGPTSSGSFALTLIRGSPHRAIHGPVRLAWRPARLPPDQCQDSAVTYVAICVVSAIVIEKHFGGSGCDFDYRSSLRVGMQFVTLRVTQRFSLSGGLKFDSGHLYGRCNGLFAIKRSVARLAPASLVRLHSTTQCS
ncbi:hypothetical protein SAMN05444065_11122 [Pseudomonas syringae]|uniref:Secreted protein n=1 Tax=Pseudomonas syringae TaxID=317 RepID=A0AB38BWE7_PSESX|nr:hypothetical protein SAMN05444065_11122 [Pseudomonas syringae]SFO57562.1 hypothetical protein SAMN05444063_11022 [Pseudomonas syringae]